MNADDSEIIDGNNDNIIENNLFVYCLNNPINMYDADGYFAFAIAGGGAWAFGGANFWNPVGWTVLIASSVATAGYLGYKVYHSSKNSKRGKGRSNLKKQGREVLEKKKQNNWEKRSGKKSRTQPRPHHPSKKGHRKYGNRR